MRSPFHNPGTQKIYLTQTVIDTLSDLFPGWQDEFIALEIVPTQTIKEAEAMNKPKVIARVNGRIAKEWKQ